MKRKHSHETRASETQRILEFTLTHTTQTHPHTHIVEIRRDCRCRVKLLRYPSIYCMYFFISYRFIRWTLRWLIYKKTDNPKYKNAKRTKPKRKAKAKIKQKKCKSKKKRNPHYIFKSKNIYMYEKMQIINKDKRKQTKEIRV